MVAALAAFGILGAIGTYAVNAIGPGIEEKVAGGGPLRVSVREDPEGVSDGFRLAARSADQVEQPVRSARDCPSLYRLAKEAGAVSVGASHYRLVVEGRTRRDVAIVDLRARILKREPILRGASIGCASAGAQDAIGVGFDLDEPAPAARRIKSVWEPLGRPYFQRANIISVKKAELQPFLIVGLASRDYVEWEIVARILVDGKESELTIDDNGQPFRISGDPTIARKSQTRYERYVDWVWWENPQRLSISTEPVS